MIEIVKKEIVRFFSGMLGYVILAVFMAVTGLFLWVVPGAWNIPLSGYASLDGLFDLAPWLFLFLVPAVSMGSFTDEFQSGTIELLLTRPIARFNIVLGKYLAILAVVSLCILFTLVYYYSVSQMAVPKGNLDHGAIIGSYIALFFLAASYGAVGVYASASAGNSAVGFIVAMALSFLLFSGFDLLAQVPFLKSVAPTFQFLGIEDHYQTFSKGLLDLSDVLYFIIVITFFLVFTHLKLGNKK